MQREYFGGTKGLRLGTASDVDNQGKARAYEGSNFRRNEVLKNANV